MNAASQHPRGQVRRLPRRFGWLAVLAFGLAACTPFERGDGPPSSAANAAGANIRTNPTTITPSAIFENLLLI